MYIDKVILEGFLSYRKKATLGPLSPGLNIIVGENGAGKSSLLCAIETLISMEFESLDRAQCLGLLSSAPGVQVNTATVEMVLNNTTRDLPSNKDVVTVTRTIGSSSTTLRLGTTTIGKKEFLSYLHSAGFSSDNMFHVIRQGQVQDILRMSSVERLRMLQRFAGWDALTKLEKFWEESTDTDDFDRQHIAKVTEECRRKLQLDEQYAKEAKEYKALELEIRTVNCIFLEREAAALKTKLEQIESSIEKIAPQHNLAKRNYMHICDALEVKQRELRRLKEDAQERVGRLEDLKEELCRATTGMVRESLQEKQLEEEIGTVERAQHELATRLSTAEHAVQETTVKLADTVQALRKLERKEDDLETRMAKLADEKNSVMQRVFHSHCFRTTQERNIWIEGELRKLESSVQEIQQQCEQLQSELQTSNAERNRCISEEEQVQAELASLRQLDGSMKAELMKLQKQSYAAIDEHTGTQRLQEDCQATLNKARETAVRIQPIMVTTMGAAEFAGWQGLKKVLMDTDDPAIGEYMGMLIDHLQVPDSLTVAVGAALGRKLFTHLVLSCSAATALLRKFYALKVRGSLGFQALDKTAVQDQYPAPKGHDVRRLIDMVDCTNPDLAPLLPHWLGKWLLCSSLEVAQEASRLYKASCVTLEGDIVNIKGAMTGGYRDPKKNLFSVYQEFCRLSDVLQSAEASLSNMSAVSRSLATESAKLLEKIRTLELKIMRNTSAMSSTESKLTLLHSCLSQIEDGIRVKEKALRQRQRLADSYAQQRMSLIKERSCARIEHLTAGAEQQLCDNTRKLQALRSKLRAVTAEKMQLLHNKNNLESLLNNCLSPGLESLKKERQSLDDKKATLEWELELSKTRLAAFDETTKASERQIAELENNSNAASRIYDLEQAVQEMSEEKARSGEDLKAASKEMEHLTLKKSNTLALLEEVTKKACMFGTVSKNLSRYRRMGKTELEHERQRLQHRISEMNPPDLLAGRLLDQASEKLNYVCKHLTDMNVTRSRAEEMKDSQKEQQFCNIEFTLKQVCKYFVDFFKRFVPHGHAKVVISTEKRNTEGEDQPERQRICKGIEFQASFSSRNILQSVECFSGGQQTVVALCFILAIQKCDPAPFYIFDEVDACLDAQHRQCLADILEELSSQSQFICTTFRPELTLKGKIFKVVHHEGTSSIAETTRQEALRIVQAIEAF
ncbi:structural maintenance of chromosomes protein 3-like isoform X1 [Dermacentor albipictus]|uniref:structural maintenance of chromosomes protein 3-like isoform X1 n=2 Tax=Dermacentor albipictus TaxID=60249 RepID=UPI0031FD3ED5